MTIEEAKAEIRALIEEAQKHRDEERAFIEGAQQYRKLILLGCSPVTYFRAVLEIMIENDPENEVHIRQSELAKWIQ